MEVSEIQAQPRDTSGTRACKRLRRQDLVPAVLYGHGQDNVMLALPMHDIEQALTDRTLVLKVIWEGREDTAQIKEVQYDAVGDNLLHVDLARISLTEKLQVTVPVKVHGEAIGLAEGGLVELVEFELEVECLPTDIPENIRVEIADLAIGDSLTIADLVFPAGVTPTGRPGRGGGGRRGAGRGAGGSRACPGADDGGA